MKTLLALCLIAFSIAVKASTPIYLECEVIEPKRVMHWQIVLNEEDGTMTVTMEKLAFSTKTYKTTFSPDSVAFGNKLISRIDLSVTQRGMNVGQCKLAQQFKTIF